MISLVKACEVIISSMGVVYDRFLHVDFLHPHAQEPVGMLIPAPEISFMNLDAIWKPFQFHVSLFSPHNISLHCIE